MASQDILIVGAGIGGLCVAIGLARAGHRVRVFEQATALREAGAGITLSTGAMRCLDMLGLGSAIRDRSATSVNLAFRHWKTGAILRCGFDANTRPGTGHEARQIHRADLLEVLRDALYSVAPQALVLGQRLSGVEQVGMTVHAAFSGGETISGGLLIAADGVRSFVRDTICPPQNLTFTGQVAFRCLVPGTEARRILADSGGSVFIGPGCTFNRYPLRQGEIMNCVGLARTDSWQQEGWSTPATTGEFLAQFAGWHAEVTGLIAAAPADGIIKWALFMRSPLPRWTLGRVTLLGDAAHPMLPFLGLGAAMAIEDGVILTRALDEHGEVHDALSAYERVRRPRTLTVYEASITQGRLAQSVDPDSYGVSSSPAHNRALFDFDPRAVGFC